MAVSAHKAQSFVECLSLMVVWMRSHRQVAAGQRSRLGLAGMDEAAADPTTAKPCVGEQVMHVEAACPELQLDEAAQGCIAHQLVACFGNKDVNPRPFSKNISHKIIGRKYSSIAVMRCQFGHHLDNAVCVFQTGVTDPSKRHGQKEGISFHSRLLYAVGAQPCATLRRHHVEVHAPRSNEAAVIVRETGGDHAHHFFLASFREPVNDRFVRKLAAPCRSHDVGFRPVIAVPTSTASGTRCQSSTTSRPRAGPSHHPEGRDRSPTDPPGSRP